MTTHSDLLHKCQDPQWAVARIEGLEGEITQLEASCATCHDARLNGIKRYRLYKARIEAVNNLQRFSCRSVIEEALDIDGDYVLADELRAALHPQEPTHD